MSLIVLIGVTGSGKTTVGRSPPRAALSPAASRNGRCCGGTPRCLDAHACVGRDPHLAITAREEAERLLRLDEGIVTLGASQPLDSATASAIHDARTRGAVVVELSADLSAVSRRENLGVPRSVGLGAPRAVLTQLMRQARVAYEAVADTTVDTSVLTPQESPMRWLARVN